MNVLCCDIYPRCKHCSGIGKANFDFKGCLSSKTSGNSAKKLIIWHTWWLGEKDAIGDLVGDWETGRSSSASIVMWRGSTVMVEEAV